MPRWTSPFLKLHYFTSGRRTHEIRNMKREGACRAVVRNATPSMSARRLCVEGMNGDDASNDEHCPLPLKQQATNRGRVACHRGPSERRGGQSHGCSTTNVE